MTREEAVIRHRRLYALFLADKNLLTSQMLEISTAILKAVYGLKTDEIEGIEQNI